MDAGTQSTGAARGIGYRLLRRMIDARPEELKALAWSWLYILAVFASYYVIRPVRDEIGVSGGVENLPWLFTGTLLGMLAVNPPFAALVARLPRARFIAVTYRFFMANLLLFFLLLASAVLLEVAMLSVRRLSRLSQALSRNPAARGEKAVIGGGVFSGVARAFKSPYLLGIGVYMLLYSITSTFLYFEQAAIVAH